MRHQSNSYYRLELGDTDIHVDASAEIVAMISKHGGDNEAHLVVLV